MDPYVLLHAPNTLNRGVNQSENHLNEYEFLYCQIIILFTHYTL